MKFSLSAINYDDAGSLMLDYIPSSSSLGDSVRRRTRVKTLDGGHVIEDRGFSHSDRSFGLAVKRDPETEAALEGLVQSHPMLKLSIEDRSFRVSTSSITRVDDRTLVINLDVEEAY
jgi:hypothetical protein